MWCTVLVVLFFFFLWLSFFFAQMLWLWMILRLEILPFTALGMLLALLGSLALLLCTFLLLTRMGIWESIETGISTMFRIRR